MEEQLEEEEMIMFPENMFISLLDTDLQQRILNGKQLYMDVKNAMEMLLQEGPTSLKDDLEDWKIEEVDGKKIMKRTTFLKTRNYDKMWSKCTMITKQLDTLESWEHTTPYNNTTGGQDYEC